MPLVDKILTKGTDGLLLNASAHAACAYACIVGVRLMAWTAALRQNDWDILTTLSGEGWGGVYEREDYNVCVSEIYVERGFSMEVSERFLTRIVACDDTASYLNRLISRLHHIFSECNTDCM